MCYGDFKNLNRRTAADKVLRDKTFNIAKNKKYDGYQRGLVSMVYIFLIKKLLVEVLKVKLFIIKNKHRNYTNQLLETLIKKSALPFIDNICGADLVDMQLISKFSKGFRF